MSKDIRRSDAVELINNTPRESEFWSWVCDRVMEQTRDRMEDSDHYSEFLQQLDDADEDEDNPFSWDEAELDTVHMQSDATDFQLTAPRDDEETARAIIQFSDKAEIVLLHVIRDILDETMFTYPELYAYILYHKDGLTHSDAALLMGYSSGNVHAGKVARIHEKLIEAHETINLARRIGGEEYYTNDS